MPIALALVWAVGFGLAAAWLAARRRRSVALWAAYGAILGPVGLGLLWVAPPGRCAFCDSPTPGWLTDCRWCGNDVRGPRELLADAALAEDDEPDPARSAPEPRPARAAAHAPPASLLERGHRASATDLGHRPAEPTPTRATAVDRWSGSEPEVAPAPERESAPAPARRRRVERARVTEPERNGTGAGAVAIAPASPRVLATAVFITGSVGLTPGARYILEVLGGAFRVLGPVDVDPARVALERPLQVMDATAFEGRLVINERAVGPAGAVLAFMSLSGATPAAVADEIVRFADEGRT